MITEHDRIVFTTGACHRLALALHKVTGWPVCTFWVGHPDYHAFVRTPRGTFLDVTGEHTREEMLNMWLESGHGHIRTVRPDFRFRDWDGDNPYAPYSDYRATELVPEVLALYREDEDVQ